MKTVLTVKEVEEQYPDELVLLEDFEMDENHALVGGKVLAHSKCRQEIYEMLPRLRDRKIFLLSTGEMPEDMMILI